MSNAIRSPSTSCPSGNTPLLSTDCHVPSLSITPLSAILFPLYTYSTYNDCYIIKQRLFEFHVLAPARLLCTSFGVPCSGAWLFDLRFRLACFSSALVLPIPSTLDRLPPPPTAAPPRLRLFYLTKHLFAPFRSHRASFDRQVFATLKSSIGPIPITVLRAPLSLSPRLQ